MSCSGTTEGAHGGEGTTVLAVQLANAITSNDQFALLAARQIEVVSRADRGRPGRARRTRAADRRRDPVHRTGADHPTERQTSPLLAWVLLFGLSVKTPWQFLRGLVQGSVEAPGRVAAAFSAWSCGNPGSEP
jgi:hypothetical protein